MVAGVMDINTDPGCSTVMNPDMVLGHILGLDDTTAQGGSIIYPVLFGSSGSLTLKY